MRERRLPSDAAAKLGVGRLRKSCEHGDAEDDQSDANEYVGSSIVVRTTGKPLV